MRKQTEKYQITFWSMIACAAGFLFAVIYSLTQNL